MTSVMTICLMCFSWQSNDKWWVREHAGVG